MNNVKSITEITKRELEMGVAEPGRSSWHDDYRGSAYVFVGGLSYDLTEGDVLSVMSQYGEIVNINLVRDKKTGKSKGFCFISYEDQRSTTLAVDNLNGMKLSGRTVRVDHVKEYRRPKDEHGNEIMETGCAPKTPTPSPSPEPRESKKKKKKEKKKEKKKSKTKNDDIKREKHEDSDSSVVSGNETRRKRRKSSSPISGGSLSPVSGHGSNPVSGCGHSSITGHGRSLISGRGHSPVSGHGSNPVSGRGHSSHGCSPISGRGRSPSNGRSRWDDVRKRRDSISPAHITREDRRRRRDSYSPEKRGRSPIGRRSPLVGRKGGRGSVDRESPSRDRARERRDRYRSRSPSPKRRGYHRR